MTRQLVVGIDASRNRSGGAKTHLMGLLTEGDPRRFGVREVHLWTNRSLSDAIPDRPWLIKHSAPALQRSLARQLWWQATALAGEARRVGCDILFTTDASTLCRFTPMVVMSQDMLSYEPGVARHFGYTRERLRLIAIFLLQNRAFRRASGVIFLTRYAADMIQRFCGPLRRVACIPHGVDLTFKRTNVRRAWPDGSGRPIRCVYVSPTSMFKHQWVVVRAVAMLRRRGYDLRLALIGGGAGKAQQLLDDEVACSDPKGEFVEQIGPVPHDALPSHLAGADLFLFSSSCENLPISLLEGMAVGLPIACSNRGPMPEVLGDGGVLFDPEDPGSIAAAVERLLIQDTLRETVARRAKALGQRYSWSRCADETWAFLVSTYQHVHP